MPEPAIGDPGGDMWVVGSEGGLGAGESVGTPSKSPAGEGAPLPPR